MGRRIRAALAIALGVAMVASGLGVAAASTPPQTIGPLPWLGPGALAGSAVPSAYFSSGMNASQVLGKTNFTLSPALTNASTFCNANTAEFDRAGDLWVADYCNNRVLEFVPPFSNSMTASLVLGQPTFTSGQSGTTASSLYQPSALAFDASGDLWVADSFNNRVLEFVPPFTSGMSASLVLGQSSFTTKFAGSGSGQLNAPDEVAFDAAGDLWVSEFVNNRVTEFVPPFSNGMPAEVVLGQPTFGPTGPGVGPDHLRGPFGVAFNATGALFLADTNNNRILVFLPPFTSGASASAVLGQPNFTASAPGVGATSFYGPNYLTFDAEGNLWVGDTNNNRVLEFPAPVDASSRAVLVLGQPNMTARLAHTSARGMSNPEQALVGPGGMIYVAEFSNSRVLGFSPPFENGSAAALVIGQWGFDVSSTAPTASNLGRSLASAYDANGDLWVVDTYDNRVLEFPPPITLGESATVVLGQPSLNDSLNGQTASNFFLPEGLAFAPNGALWVSDSYNSRLLEFLPPFATGMAASVVLGQPNFTANAPATSNRSLALPGGIAFDPNGDLWVADSLNSRVLEFEPPFTTYEAATTVIGQTNFDSPIPGTSPTSLFLPSSIAFDANGTLYVSDSYNSRVLSYSAPLGTGEAASGVLGQTNFYSGGPGTGPGALDQPAGIAVDPRGQLWVADAQNNRVLRYSLPIVDGSPANLVLGQPSLSTVAPGTTSGSLRQPGGVTLDPVAGGVWVADYGNSRLLYFPGNAESVATGTVVFSHGRGAINQRPITGVQLNFSSVSGLSSATVITQRLAGEPTGTTPTGFTNTTYFDVAVSPLAGASGTVQVCLTVPGVLVQGQMLYWLGTTWAIAGSISVSHSTACGVVPLAALTGTPVALSVPGPSQFPSFPTLYLFVGATIVFIAIAAGLVLFNLRKQRRLAAQAPPPGSAPLGSSSSSEAPPPKPPTG